MDHWQREPIARDSPLNLAVSKETPTKGRAGVSPAIGAAWYRNRPYDLC